MDVVQPIGNIAVKPIIIAEHYQLISGMMRGLHENERLLNGRTALWDDIEQSYMRHVIAMQEEQDGVCLIAFVDGEPAGFIFGYAEEEDDSRIEENVGIELYVSDGFVFPQFRRIGVYRHLNSSLEDHFIKTRVKRITRFTMVNNRGMRYFLEEEGYTLTRVLYEKWL